MDKENFLESGLLQQYALGLTDEEESAKVEEYLRAYPEIRNELQQMHAVLDSYAEQLDIPPKEEKPQASASSKNEIKSDRSEKNQFIHLRRSTLSFLVLLIAGLASTSIYFYSQNLILQHELETHEAKIAHLDEKYDHKQTEQLPLLEELNFIEHEKTEKIYIDSLSSCVGRALVYWNPLEEHAIIQLLDYRSDMEIDELYLFGFVASKTAIITKLKKHSCELQPIPFFENYHDLHIADQPPAEDAVPKSNNLGAS